MGPPLLESVGQARTIAGVAGPAPLRVPATVQKVLAFATLTAGRDCSDCINRLRKPSTCTVAQCIGFRNELDVAQFEYRSSLQFFAFSTLFAAD